MQVTIIHQKIYEVRGQKVMLDYDLAKLYEVETRVLNQAIKRNMDSFPEYFIFRLLSAQKLRYPTLLLNMALPCLLVFSAAPKQEK